jgi:carboxymethylenebutenolidase
MCDDITETENAQWRAGAAVNRRQFATLGASAAALTVVPGCMAAPD